MATIGDGLTLGHMVAAADLSGNRYYTGQINSSGQVALGGAAAAQGVIMNAPASGEAVLLQVAGLAKVVAAAAITAGDIVASNAAGKVAAATTGQRALGIAVEAAAADGDVIQILLGVNGREP